MFDKVDIHIDYLVVSHAWIVTVLEDGKFNVDYSRRQFNCRNAKNLAIDYAQNLGRMFVDDKEAREAVVFLDGQETFFYWPDGE